MPAVNFESLDVEQGFNYNRDVQNTFGFLYSLQIGDGSQIKINATTTVREPTGNEDQRTVVGVLGSWTWDGGNGDPLKMKTYISTGNKQLIQKLLHEKLNNTTCKLAFNIFEYDPIEKKWFKAVWHDDNDPPSAQLDGLILKEDKKLVFEIDKEPGSIKSPQNWGLTIGIMPAPNQQAIHYATGYNLKVSKQWGISVAAAATG